jgi:acetate kinase
VSRPLRSAFRAASQLHRVTTGFTPLDGLVMAPGPVRSTLVLWLETHAAIPAAELSSALEHQSGFYARAGTGDMRQILSRAAAADTHAELARDVYLHRR